MNSLKLRRSLSCGIMLILAMSTHIALLHVSAAPPQNTISVRNVDKLVELRRLGDGSIMDVSWSADGKQVITAGSLGVWLHDGATLGSQMLLKTTQPMYSLA